MPPFAWQSNKAILFYFAQNSVSEIQFGTDVQRPNFGYRRVDRKKEDEVSGFLQHAEAWLVYVEVLLDLENDHYLIIIVKILSDVSYQWMSNLEGP